MAGIEKFEIRISGLVSLSDPSEKKMSNPKLKIPAFAEAATRRQAKVAPTHREPRCVVRELHCKEIERSSRKPSNSGSAIPLCWINTLITSPIPISGSIRCFNESLN